MSTPAKAQCVWRDCEWIAWGMAKVENTYRWLSDKNPNPGKSEWTF